MPLRFIDLCCGAGGFTQGLSRAGLQHVLGVDVNERCGQSYEANHGRGTFMQASITDRGLSKAVQSHARALHGSKRIDLVAASPPCQTLSIANMGKHAGHVAQDLLCMDVVRIAHELRAPLILIENVQGMERKLTAKGTTVLQELVEAMEARGYVVNSKLITCTDLGVPQTRKRLFVLGAKRVHRVGARVLRRFAWPEGKRTAALTMRKCLLPPRDPRLRAPHNVWMTPSKMRFWLDRKNGPSGSYVHFVDPDKPSRTITAGYAKRQGEEGLVMYDARGRITLDPKKTRRMRKLSVLECARVQTFPDTYKFIGSVVSNQYFQVGNAVPPRAAAALGCALLAAWQ